MLHRLSLAVGGNFFGISEPAQDAVRAATASRQDARGQSISTPAIGAPTATSILDKIMNSLRYVASRSRQQPSTDRSIAAFACPWCRGIPIQVRSRVFQTKKTKAAINPTTRTIQFCTSKPRIVKCSMRNCTAPLPLLVQNRRFCEKNIFFLYFYRVRRRRFAVLGTAALPLLSASPSAIQTSSRMPGGRDG
jgi:hypothetical protein